MAVLIHSHGHRFYERCEARLSFVDAATDDVLAGTSHKSGKP